jgi:NAD(P)-dependent dehydrogenase (short-subunit alcohol dehydrogenase family)
MARTVLITGCSSGFGRAAVVTFMHAGWNVVATMRNTADWQGAPPSDRLLVVPLDVRDDATITASVSRAIEYFGRVDCVVNNAGQGLFSVFEATPMETVQAMFDTNVFGAMRVMQAVLPHFRKLGGGRFVNVSSGSVILPEPFMSIYGASKSALDNFTEAVQYELKADNVVTKLVVPGFVPGTQFAAQTRTAAGAIQVPESSASYFAQRIASYSEMNMHDLASEIDVAKAILDAAVDTTDRLRFIVGSDTALSAHMRYETSDAAYSAWAVSKFAYH